MIFGKEKSLKDGIINIGKKLYDLRLVVSRSGNLSCRIDENNIFVTATGTCLGSLTYDDIIKVDITADTNKERLTSEFPFFLLLQGGALLFF